MTDWKTKSVYIVGLSLLEHKDDPLEDWRQKFWTSYKVCIKSLSVFIKLHDGDMFPDLL